MDVTNLRQKVDDLAGALDQLPEYNKSARQISSYEAARSKYESENPTMAGFDKFWQKQQAKADWRERGSKILTAIEEDKLSRLVKGDYSDTKGASAKNIIQERIQQKLIKLPQDIQEAGKLYTQLVEAEQSRIDAVNEAAAAQRQQTRDQEAKAHEVFLALERQKREIAIRAELDAQYSRTAAGSVAGAAPSGRTPSEAEQQAADRDAERQRKAYEAWRDRETAIRMYESDNPQNPDAAAKAKLDRQANSAAYASAQAEAATEALREQRQLEEQRRRDQIKAQRQNLDQRAEQARAQIGVLDERQQLARGRADRAAKDVDKHLDKLRAMGVAAGNEKINFSALAASGPAGRRNRSALRKQIDDANRTREITDRLAAGEDARPRNQRDRDLLDKVIKEQTKLKAAEARKAKAEDAQINLERLSRTANDLLTAIAIQTRKLGMAD
jgi:hypothetical protein